MSGRGGEAWIVKPKPSSLAEIRLFTFPFAGGHAGVYERWPEVLPPEVELCAIQYPGRQSHSFRPPMTRMVRQVLELEKALEPYLDLPAVLFGTCTGSLVAFELARRLERSGRGPFHFVSSCCRAPHLPDRDAPIHALEDDALAEELGRLGNTPPEVLEHPELRTVFFPVLRADFELAETYRYRPGPPLSCPVTAVGGLDDPIVDPEEISAWKEQTESGFRMVMLPGGHDLVLSGRDDLGELLSSILTPYLTGELPLGRSA